MRCSVCDKENTDSSSYCIYCGAGLHNTEDENALADIGPDRCEDQQVTDDLTQDIRQLQKQMRHVLSIISQQGATVLTRQSGGPPSNLVAESDTEETIPKYSLLGNVDWEPLVGGNWLARIGVLAIVIGTAFFLKLAFDNNWIGEQERVILGVLGGVAFLVGSQYWFRKYPVYAQALAGGGIGILYLSIFSAFVPFNMISFYPAIALLLLISSVSAGLALRYDSLTLAIIGIVGAFMAPFILNGFTETMDVVLSADRNIESLQLIVYVVIVDLGVLVLSTFKNWRWLTLAGLVGSLATFGIWHEEYRGTIGHLVSQGSITLIFLLFVGATTLFHLIWRRSPKSYDFTLIAVNASAYLLISYSILWDDFRDWMGGFTLLLSFFYGLISYFTFVKIKEHVSLAVMSLGIALIFLTIAIPVEMDQSWVAVAWSTQAAVLMWLSFRLQMWRLRLAGLGVFTLLIIRVLVFDTSVENLGDFHVILNSRMLAFSAAISALYIGGYFVNKNRRGGLIQSQQSAWNDETRAADSGILSVFSNSMLALETVVHSRFLFPGLLAIANFLTVWILSAEVISVVDSGIIDIGMEAESHIKSLSLSLLWGIYASVMLVVGIVWRWQAVRLGGLALLSIPVIKLFVVDTFDLEQGYRVAAYFSLGFIMLVGGLLYQRYSAAIKRFLFEEQTGPV